VANRDAKDQIGMIDAIIEDILTQVAAALGRR